MEDIEENVEENMEENTFLVVCIQEFEKNNNIDTTLFFTYDRRFDEYVLWGKRGLQNDVPFMLRFDTFNDMDNFIHMCILHTKSKYDKFTIGLNNINIFPLDFNVSYDFLYNNMNSSHEITSYENVFKKDMKRCYLRKWAHICKYSYNRIDGEIV